MSGCTHRYNLDLPETMAAREKLLTANVNIASSRQEFRAWLEAHHASEDECWLRVCRGRCLTSGVCVMESCANVEKTVPRAETSSSGTRFCAARKPR